MLEGLYLSLYKMLNTADKVYTNKYGGFQRITLSVQWQTPQLVFPGGEKNTAGFTSFFLH